MEDNFKIWKSSRKLYVAIFEQYNTSQLNQIPAGFNNNLIWNIGHIIVAQQSLIYKSSNVPMCISEDLFDRYKPGTKPAAMVSSDQISELKTLLTSLIEQTENDFYSGKFVVFNERTTSTGFHLASLSDAVAFNTYHEGLHLGYIMSIRKFI